MTPHEVYEQLAIRPDGPGFSDLYSDTATRLRVKTDDNDRMAGRLLLWLEGQMPGRTLGDMNDVLHTAIWWSTLMEAMEDAPEQAEGEMTHDPT